MTNSQSGIKNKGNVEKAPESRMPNMSITYFLVKIADLQTMTSTKDLSLIVPTAASFDCYTKIITPV